jgi:hypothetical protein
MSLKRRVNLIDVSACVIVFRNAARTLDRSSWPLLAPVLRRILGALLGSRRPVLSVKAVAAGSGLVDEPPRVPLHMYVSEPHRVEDIHLRHRRELLREPALYGAVIVAANGALLALAGWHRGHARASASLYLCVGAPPRGRSTS